MRDFNTVSQQIDALYQQVMREENKGRYSEELWHYYPQLTHTRGRVQETRYVYDLCRLARFDPEGKRVLGAGCGYGLQLIVLHYMGAREGVGFDLSENRLTTFQQIIADFNLSDSLKAYLKKLEAIDFEPASFDMILSNEAISHYLDVALFFERAAYWLRRGGVLIIADGNNGANPKLAQHTREVWRRFEQGPTGRIGVHNIQQTYQELRAELIQQAYPQLDTATIRQLAERTSLMTREAILEAVERYVQTGEMPNSRFDGSQCPVHPYSGEVIERLFHPMELARHLSQYGFRARAYAYFGGAGGNPLIRAANRVLQWFTPISLRWAPSFRVVAYKA
ncbi:MAG: class I SAM-dependent methyltransferase [Fimbriimonadales bacterium]|nr:class I SAM-dependent methyltransferase [Fimbriimonadales bacterium]